VIKILQMRDPVVIVRINGKLRSTAARSGASQSWNTEHTQSHAYNIQAVAEISGSLFNMGCK